MKSNREIMEETLRENFRAKQRIENQNSLFCFMGSVALVWSVAIIVILVISQLQ